MQLLAMPCTSPCVWCIRGGFERKTRKYDLSTTPSSRSHKWPFPLSCRTDPDGFSGVDVCNGCVCYLCRDNSLPFYRSRTRCELARFLFIRFHPKRKGPSFWVNVSLLCALRGKYRLNRKPIASMRRRKRSPRALFHSRRCYNRQEVAGGIIQQRQGSHSTQGCWVNEQSCNSSRDRNLVSEDLVCPLTSTFKLGTLVKVRIISVNPEKSDATAAPDVRRPVFTSTLPTSALSIGTNVGGAVTIRATIYWPETLP